MSNEVHPSGVPPASKPSRGQLLSCDRHPEEVAVWRCRACGAKLCADCPLVREVRRVPIRSCPACETAFRLTPLSDEELDPRLHTTLFFEAPRYPLLGDGPYMLGWSAPLSLILFFTRDLIFANSVFAFILALFIGAYAAAVLRASADGEPAAPGWPDLSAATAEVYMPLGFIMLATIFTFGPAIAWEIWVSPSFASLGIAAWILGALVWPMGVVALSLYGSLGALHPVFLLRSIARAPVTYGQTVVASSAALVVEGFLIGLLGANFLVFLPAFVALIYVLMVHMRVIGVFYYTHRKRLGWFDK